VIVVESINIATPDAGQNSVFHGCDIIFVSLENWDEIWRRNQFLCDALSRRFPDSKILFVAPPRDISNSIRHGRFSDLNASATWTAPEHPNITITRPLKCVPNSLTLCRRFNEAMSVRHIRKVAADLGMSHPLLWLNPHFGVSMVGKFDECAVIYDVTDDWTELDQGRREAQLIAEQDRALCLKADAVIVCSERLREKKRAYSQCVHLIPNGVHTEHYEHVLDRAMALPAESAQWKHPVLGYTGTVHSSRVDVALVADLAKSYRTGSIVLIGPDYLSPAEAARLDAFDNVYRVPGVPYSRIPGFMRTFDVCIVPHRMTAFTESLNPIKLWEYLAAGKPIVSTSVPGFRDFPNLVHIANDPESFVAKIEEALRERGDLAGARRTEARKHSWDNRVDDVVRVIASCVNVA
jgi:glycosyltransferase involved in cell wall biosynthesis